MISQRVIKRFCMVRALREKSLNPFNCRWTIGKSEKSYEISHSHAFTLIELLIVIAIIAILGSATVLVLNPVEIIKQGRDGTRITDVENIQKSLNLTLFNNPSLVDSLLSTNIYLSLPSGSCPLSPPTGYTYVCNATSANINKTDGTGWIPLTLQNMASLPTDPNSNFYYAFIANPTTKTFTVTALLESEKQTKLSAAKDGGTDPGRFEKGDTVLWTAASGLVTLFNFDEPIGAISTGKVFNDVLGGTNFGTASNANGTGMSFVVGKSGNAIQCDGSDDRIDQTGINGEWIAVNRSNMSISAWVKTNLPNTDKVFMGVQFPADQRLYLATYNSKWDMGVYNSGWGGGNKATSTDWTHYMITLNSSNIATLYINGELSYTKNFNTSYFPTGPFPMCAYTNSNGSSYAYHWNGLIDDIRFYNRALTIDEAKAIYNAHK